MAPDYTEDLKNWLKETELKVGDSVIVFAKSHPCGWKSIWLPEMDETLGKELIVHFISDHAICLKYKSQLWWYPFFVLIKVMDEDEEGEN